MSNLRKQYVAFRYGGLVFKDYVYEPGMVADLADIYSSLFAKEQAKVFILFFHRGRKGETKYFDCVSNIKYNESKYNIHYHIYFENN